MNLTINKDKVLQAAKECQQAEKVLKTLFPEAFEDDKYFNLRNEDMAFGHIVYDNGTVSICLCGNADTRLTDKAFFLPGEACYWELVNRGVHYLLIPTKKP